jgi:crossover junction endodeoxyribonuclease RuvC
MASLPALSGAFSTSWRPCHNDEHHRNRHRLGRRAGLLDEAGGLIEVADMPILRDGPKNRPSVKGALLAAIIRRWRASHAYVEYVGARPGEGAVGAFAFGRSRGVVEGVLGALAAFPPPP